MKLISHFTPAFISLFIALSCSSDLLFLDDKKEPIRAMRTQIEQIIEPPDPILGYKVTNPYSIDIMQCACDSLCTEYNLPTYALTYTDLYVRFLPRDSTDYSLLTNLNLELFDYPLDYENVPQEGYHDPSLPMNQMTWQYTTIPSGMTIPDVPHEILDTCYIPPIEATDVLQSSPKKTLAISDGPSGFNQRLEQLAFQLANPNQLVGSEPLEPVDEINALGNKPTGTVKVYNDNLEDYIPVKGVKVRVNNIVKYDVAYTDQNGYYSFDKRFLTNVHYSLKFENSESFKIYGSYISPTPAFCWYGFHSSSGYNIDITKSQDSWIKAIVNNVIYEYYQTCSADGRIAPLRCLRVYALTNCPGNSCPMFSKIGYQTFRDYSSNEIAEAILQSLGVIGASIILNVIKYALPDITIHQQESYNKTQQVIYHEMSHASHFAGTGTSVWVPLIVYNALCGSSGYGDGTDNNHMQDVCELSESWGFANERIMQKVLGETPTAWSGDWFSPSIDAIFTLIDRGIVSEKDILQCMPANVESITELHNKLILVFPDNKEAITETFVEAGAFPEQTQWKFINTSGQPLSLSWKKNEHSTSILLANGDTCNFINTPFIESSFYINNTHPEYYPDEITIKTYDGTRIIFHQKNGITDTSSLHNPFFYIHSWIMENHISNPVKIKKTYTFSFTPFDVS